MDVLIRSSKVVNAPKKPTKYDNTTKPELKWYGTICPYICWNSSLFTIADMFVAAAEVFIVAQRGRGKCSREPGIVPTPSQVLRTNECGIEDKVLNVMQSKVRCFARGDIRMR
jgi:hypothetical protein